MKESAEVSSDPYRVWTRRRLPARREEGCGRDGACGLLLTNRQVELPAHSTQHILALKGIEADTAAEPHGVQHGTVFDVWQERESDAQSKFSRIRDPGCLRTPGNPARSGEPGDHRVAMVLVHQAQRRGLPSPAPVEPELSLEESGGANREAAASER